MRDQPMLSEDEQALVIELLQLELRELPVEVRHASNQEVHDELHRRLERVQRLLHKLQQPTVA